MLLVVGIAVLMRRGWRIALLHTVPLAGAYFVWSAVSPKGQSAGSYGSQTPVQVIKFVFIGAGSALGRLSQLPGLGIVLALVLIVGLAVAISRAGRDDVRTRYSVPLALLLGSLVFLIVTGLARSGQHAEIAGKLGTGPERARLSRYVYVVAAMALPAIAIAVDAIARRWRLLTIPLVVLLLAGVPGNVHQLRIYTNLSSIDRAQLRVQILEAPRLPLARKLPAGAEPARRSTALRWAGSSTACRRGGFPRPRGCPRTRSRPRRSASRCGRRRPRPARTAGCSSTPRRRCCMCSSGSRSRPGRRRSATSRNPESASAPIPFVGGTTLIAVTGPLPIEITPTLAPARLCG